jgi:hypothetical protein
VWLQSFRSARQLTTPAREKRALRGLDGGGSLHVFLLVRAAELHEHGSRAYTHLAQG